MTKDYVRDCTFAFRAKDGLLAIVCFDEALYDIVRANLAFIVQMVGAFHLLIYRAPHFYLWVSA